MYGVCGVVCATGKGIVTCCCQIMRDAGERERGVEGERKVRVRSVRVRVRIRVRVKLRVRVSESERARKSASTRGLRE